MLCIISVYPSADNAGYTFHCSDLIRQYVNCNSNITEPDLFNEREFADIPSKQELQLENVSL